MKHTSQFNVGVLITAIYKAALRHQSTKVSGKVNPAGVAGNQHQFLHRLQMIPGFLGKQTAASRTGEAD
jgi:hypothetical protein